MEGAVWGSLISSGTWCETGVRCRAVEDLYFDDVLLTHADAFADPLGDGKWFFDYDANVIWVGQNPAYASKVEQCANESAFWSTAADIYLHDFVVEKYASKSQYGAVGSKSPSLWIGNDWICENLTARYNHGIGIRVHHGMQVLDCDCVYNGQMGIGGGGSGVLYQGGELAYNNTAGYDAHEAGGSKFAFTNGLVIRDVNCHHNKWLTGLWLDIDNINYTIEDCTVADNTDMGIMVEISYGGVIRRNKLLRNGAGVASPNWYNGAAINVFNSSDVEVYENYLVDNVCGVVGIAYYTGFVGGLGPLDLKNLYVHDNYIHQTVKGSGVVSLTDPAAWGAEWNNRFENNHYRFTDAGNHFAWAGGERNIAEWLAYGHDLSEDNLSVLI
jgi:parallel beta-helix repeat protein